MTDYRLHYAPDNASLVIRLALLELEQPFDTVLVDRAQKAQKSPAYLALNPNGLIPTLETPAGPLFETAAILIWLDEVHGGLLPPHGTAERAHALKWLLFLSNTLHVGLRLLFYPAQYIDKEQALALHEATKPRLVDLFGRLDDAAAAPWLFADTPENTPGAVELYLCCMLRWVGVYPAGRTQWFDLSAFPRLKNGAAKVEARASVRAAAKAEGLGPRPFTDPQPCNPPHGSAT